MKFVFAALLLAATAANATTNEQGDYRIDPTRSQAEFSVRLLWLRSIQGRFTRIAGNVQLERHDMATVDARVALDSVTMPSARTRAQMLGPDFFDARRYPRIRFQSDPLPAARLTQGGIMEGRLTLRGITRHVRLHLRPAHCRQLAARACVIDVRGTIRRSDFGMNAYRAALSDKVTLGLQIALEPMPR